ncbi:hypothetical protein JAAARDRAFT_64485 [Jaapia argillacea MUCL 33604]|uniref:Structure-specific endonuclease subunit SLX4 n=1 Tax=Jaapia argillacea MUCL 33604 TaxID=933084 RepID=A0A067QC46_9AGAM|nr:hypothetical protein JAAARDRAFT_64485 [Jaapia argillacea MUCL 33604]
MISFSCMTIISRPHHLLPYYFSVPKLPSQLLSKSRMLNPRRIRTLADEVIDDSEPERESQRLAAKEGRRRAKTASQASRPPIHTIEISDSEESSIRVPPSHHDGSISGVRPSLLDEFTSTSLSQTEEASGAYTGKIVTGAESVDRPLEREGATTDSAPTPSDPSHVLQFEATDSFAPSTSRLAAVMPCPPPDVLSSDSEDEPGHHLNLGQFAYDKPRLPPKRVDSVRSRLPSSTSDELPCKKKTERRVKYGVAADFSDAQLSKLLRCVSCEQRWTTRKTSSEKVKHIQSCANKHSLANETLSALIRQELQKVVAQEDKLDGKAKVKAKSKAIDPEVPKTFLEAIVDGSGAKKKGRRVAVEATVCTLTQARGGILDRARAFLGAGSGDSDLSASSSGDNENDRIQTRIPGAKFAGVTSWETRVPVPEPDPLIPASTRAFAPSKLGQKPSIFDDEPPFPPATQAFAPSKLANGLYSRAVHAAALDEDMDAPPATQAFAPSRFQSKARGLASDWVVDIPSNNSFSQTTCSSDSSVLNQPDRVPTRHVSYSYPDVGSSSSVPCPQHPSLPSNRRGRTRSPEPRSASSSIEVIDCRNQASFGHVQGELDNPHWTNDDAVLHFSPPEDFNGELRQTISSDSDLDPRPKTLELSATRVTHAQSTTPPKRRRGRPAKLRETARPPGDDQIDDADTDLDSNLQTSIIKDTSLHLRVLRYEPIDLKVFMAMAEQLGLPPRGLKLKLRSFLDRQAINFYDAEVNGRGTRGHP